MKSLVLTPAQFVRKMMEIDDMKHPDEKHTKADELMCDTLKRLGYEDGVKIFEEMDKWYE